MILSVCQSYLVVGTDTAHIRVFDLSRRYSVVIDVCITPFGKKMELKIIKFPCIINSCSKIISPLK